MIRAWRRWRLRVWKRRLDASRRNLEEIEAFAFARSVLLGDQSGSIALALGLARNSVESAERMVQKYSDLPPCHGPGGGVMGGISHRVDRLRALGNVVVPQCAQVVGEVMNLIEEGM